METAACVMRGPCVDATAHVQIELHAAAADDDDEHTAPTASVTS